MSSHSLSSGLIRTVSILLLLWPLGCMSLDAGGDIASASSLVTDRAVVTPDWSSPWHVPSSEWDGRSPLSSDTAVRVALRNNRAIRREVETIVAARADLVQAHLIPNPVINVALGFPTDGLGGDPLGASLVQQLAWLWRRPAEIDAAEAQLRARILSVSDDALRLVETTRGAHADVHYADEAARLAAENVTLLARLQTMVETRVEVGEATQLEANRVELERRAAEVVHADRVATLDRARRTLLELLGRASGAVEWTTVWPPAAPAQSDLTEADVMRLAVSQRLDVAAALASVEQQRARVGVEDANRFPEISGGVGYQQNFSNREGVFPSLSVTPKIFDDNSARRAKAGSALRQAEIEADRIRQAAIAEARRGWIAWRKERDVVDTYQSGILALARDNVDLAAAAFDVGATDLTVLLEAERAHNEQRIELADHHRDLAARRFELARAAGGALTRLDTVVTGPTSSSGVEEGRP